MPVDNPRFPHTCKISRVVRDSATQSKSPRNDDDEQESVVIYEGICRSFDFHTTSSSGELISSNRKLSLPQKQDEWTEETIPQEGDIVEVQKFGYTEYGLVKDIMPSNLGTHILWNYGRN